jgi:hypothetical protein
MVVVFFLIAAEVALWLPYVKKSGSVSRTRALLLGIALFVLVFCGTIGIAVLSSIW